MDYLGNLTAFRLSLVREVGGFQPEFGEAALYDLALRVAEKAVSVRHVPLVLYHARTPSGAGLDSGATGARAVREHLERLHIPADIEPGLVPGARQVRYRVGRPLTSIIIPSKDQPAAAGAMRRVPPEVRLLESRNRFSRYRQRHGGSSSPQRSLGRPAWSSPASLGPAVQLLGREQLRRLPSARGSPGVAQRRYRSHHA